jgi:hypothetical protein
MPSSCLWKTRRSSLSVVKELIFDVSKKFGVRGVTRKRVVPYVTVIGPIKNTLSNNEQLNLRVFVNLQKRGLRVCSEL